MLALKEFANFISLNVANLATTYDRLLVEKGGVDETLPADSRIASARRLIKTVAEACEIGTPEPFCRLFKGLDDGSLPPSVSPKFAIPWLQIECLGQTLTPIVTNLEAGKFLWQMLAEARATVFRAMESALPSLPSGGVGVSKNVTEDKQVEEQLHKLSRAVEQSPSIVVITDPKGRIEYVNPKFSQITGYSLEEVVGQNPRLLKSGETSPEEYQRLWDTIVSGGEWRGELHNKKKNGELYWVSSSISPIKNSEGVTTHFLSVQEDITERKRAEEALRESQKRNRLVIDTALDAVIAIDAAGLIIEWNAQAETTFGWSCEEVIGQPLSETIIPPPYREAHRRGLEHFLATGEGPMLNKRIEMMALHRSEREFPVELAISPIRLGETVTFSGFVRDITERRRLEQQIQESLERRTRQVQISTEIAQETANVLALDDLFRRVVNMVQEQFGYYYVQIYMLDEDDMVLQEGTGEAGRQMKEAGYRIPLSAEQSLVVRTIWSGEPVLVPDVSQELAWLPNPLLPETKAELVVPISLGAEVLGVLDVQSDTVGGLNEEDQLLLVGLCGQIAVAINSRRVEIERERLLAETEARLQEIQALQQFSQDLAGSLQVSGILDVFFRACTQLAGFEYVQFSLVDKNQQRVKAIAGFNVSQDQLRRANHPLDSRDIMTDIVRTGQTEVVTGWDDRFDRENFEAEGYADWVRIFTPVTLRGENIGLVEAGYNKNVQNIPQDTQIRLLRALIDQIVLALDSAQRYEASQKAAHREQTIREITAKMRAASSLEGLVKTAACELGQRLSAGHAIVELGVAEADEPAVPANGKFESVND